MHKATYFHSDYGQTAGLFGSYYKHKQVALTVSVQRDSKTSGMCYFAELLSQLTANQIATELVVLLQKCRKTMKVIILMPGYVDIQTNEASCVCLCACVCSPQVRNVLGT